MTVAYDAWWANHRLVSLIDPDQDAPVERRGIGSRGKRGKGQGQRGGGGRGDGGDGSRGGQRGGGKGRRGHRE